MQFQGVACFYIHVRLKKVSYKLKGRRKKVGETTMGLLIFAYRKLDIIRQRNDIQYRLMNLTRKLSDLQQYASNIADGSVSMSDMMNTPSSMFGRQMMYMQYAHNGAIFGAQQKFGMMQPMIAAQMQQMQDPNMQAM